MSEQQRPHATAPKPKGHRARTYRRRRITTFLTTAVSLGLILAIIAGGLVYVLFEPQYETSAWLRTESRVPYVAFPPREDSRRFVATQVELIRSPLVLGPVVSDPEITPHGSWVYGMRFGGCQLGSSSGLASQRAKDPETQGAEVEGNEGTTDFDI
jgi:hypothetical protein